MFIIVIISMKHQGSWNLICEITMKYKGTHIFMPLTSKKLREHIGLGLSVCLLTNVYLCVIFYLQFVLMCLFFSCVPRNTSRLVQNGLVLHPELSGESKHRRNLDTKCPENVQKCVQMLLRIMSKGIQKSSMLIGWIFLDTEVWIILIGQYFSHTSTETHNPCLCRKQKTNKEKTHKQKTQK